MSENKPRWEVKYEKYLSEEPVEEKILKIEKDRNSKASKIKRSAEAETRKLEAEIETLKNEKVTGDFKTKEEYEQAVANHEALIANKQNEIITIKTNAKSEIESIKNDPETVKELNGYKNYEKNKTEIQNILEYRNKLKEKLNNLPKDNTEALVQKKAEIEKNEKTLAEQENRLDDLIKYVNSNQNSKDLLDKQEELSITVAVVKNLKEQKGKLDVEFKELENKQKAYELAEAKRKVYDRQIIKCDKMAARLLEGKDLEEIKLSDEHSDKSYTSPDGKLPQEIEKEREAKKAEKALEAENKEKQEEVKPEKEEKVEEPEVKENTEIATTNSLLSRFPWLAKISNFFKNLKNRFISRDKKEEMENKEIVAEAVKEYKENNPEQFLEETLVKDNASEKEPAKEDLVDEKANETKANTKKEDYNQIVEDIEEDKFLKEVAEKGAAKAFRDRQAEYRKAAANKYAKTYGGRYENQDGATVKKDDGFEH